MDIYQQSFNKLGCIKSDGPQIIEPDLWTPNFTLDEASSKMCSHAWSLQNELSCCGRQPRLRKIRPRSSTDRSQKTCKVELRIRSPSVSPVRALQSTANTATTENSFTDDFIKQRIYALGQGGKAFFSSRPPIEPMRIVFVGSTHQQKGYPMPKEMQEFPSNLCGASCIGDSCEIVPPVFLGDCSVYCIAPAPAAATSSRTSSQNPGEVTSKSTRQSRKKKNGEMVLLLLVELVTNLPLPVPVVDVSTTATSTLGLPREVASHRRRRVRRRSDQSRCNIAVQVLATEESVSLISHDDEQGKEIRECGDEWVGGVRALRDSHVRLVLHQLRHIDRMNRALDRAFRARSLSSRRTRY